ncbi:MAG: hypothetical protein JOY62_07830 [Acidobacteriaceae bacterium]|nr:hypothetical protein [Acidobacteriaceae bacterium]MBV9779869.1 hypothetical protein [Acidobacteriaceae bacterium]
MIPHTEGTTLSGGRVAFPKTASHKPILLVLSFTHKSNKDLASWNQHFQAMYKSDLVDYYELADFQGIPGFVMKMILHGMRRSVKEPERSHLIPFFEREAYWKTLVHYDDPKIAYVVLADGSGRIVSQTRGPASDANAAGLEAAITRLRSTEK